MLTRVIPQCLFVTLSLGATLLARADDDSHPPGAQPSIDSLRTSVLFDQEVDGTQWVKGITYKMKFAAASVAYIPVFGERAPKNLPLEFAFTRASVGGSELPRANGMLPHRNGDAIEIERGALTERWTFGLESAEQDFVIWNPLRGGDVRVSLAVATELQYRGRDANGLRFEAEGLGVVNYSDVRVIDGDGRSVTTPAQWNDGAIELIAPAAFLNKARFPVVIDPIVTTIAVDTNAGRNHSSPDAAYASTYDTWQVSYVETVSASDSDIIARRFNDGFTLLDEIGIELTDEDTINPSVAASSTRFLTAWLRSSGVIGTKAQGRFRLANSTSQDAEIDLTSGNTFHGSPEVSGPSGSGANFLVVWSEKPTLQNFKVKGRTVTASGILGNVDTYSASFSDATLPAVVPTAGSDGRWVAAWVRAEGLSVADIDAAVISATGQLDARFVIDASSAGDFAPDICGIGSEYLLVWDREINSTQRNIMGNRLSRIGTSLASVTGTVDLTALEPGAVASRDQSFASVATDGCRFVYTYLDTPNDTTVSGTNFAASLFWSSEPEFLEGHVSLHGGTTGSKAPVASTLGDSTGVGENLIVFSLPLGSDNNIHGVSFTTLGPSVPNQIVQTGCAVAGPEARVTVFGNPVVGGSLTLVATDFHVTSPLILIGNPIQGGACSGSTICLRGVDPSSTVAGTLLNFPIPCVAGLVGTEIAFQGLDVLSGFAFNACSPNLELPKFTALTDTTIVTLR